MSYAYTEEVAHTIRTGQRIQAEYGEQQRRPPNEREKKKVTVEQKIAVTDESSQLKVLPIESSYRAVDEKVIEQLSSLSRRDSNGTFMIGESALEEIKDYLKKILNVPNHISLHLFSDSEGKGVFRNRNGELVIEGHCTLFSNSGYATHVGFIFNVLHRQLYMDGRQVSRPGVPFLLESIKKSLDEAVPLHTILTNVENRAQTIFFKGFIPRENNDIHMVVTHNYIEPFDFHLWIGTKRKMTPIKLMSDSGIRNNLGTFLKGKLPSNEKVILFIPFRRDDQLFICPSMNGVKIVEESVKGSSAVNLTRSVSA
jgi:hypothetical protein